MAQNIIASKPGDPWPPEGHTKRLEDYARYRQLFRGRHDEVFARVQAWLDKTPDKTLVYIVANFPKLISLICADLLFGEEPVFRVGDEGTPEQETLNAIIINNSLRTLNYEMAVSASWRGDVVFKARYGLRHSYSEGPEPIIEQVPPSYFFPDVDPDNVKDMRAAVVAWEKRQDDRTYLRKEIHLPGRIRNELWLMDGSVLKRQVPLNTLDEYRELPEEQETGYPGILVEHCPNWRLDDDFWGISDYDDIESLVDELNNRISRISRVLDKHENPKLILPPGMMEYDPATKRYYIRKEALDVVEVDAEQGANLPRYLVWDAQLEAAFKQIDKLVEIAFLVSETSPDAFGMGRQGQAESGRALKFRLLRTLGKVNRKRLYLDEALKNVLYAAQVLDVTHGGKDYKPKDVHIEWKDGLPQDDLEAAQVEQTRITSGTTSVESAVRRLDGLSGQALKDELARIRADKQSSMAAEPETRLDLGEPPEVE